MEKERRAHCGRSWKRAINCTAAHDLPIEAHLNEIDHDREPAGLWEDHRHMFGANPATSDLSVVRDAIDRGEPITNAPAHI